MQTILGCNKITTLEVHEISQLLLGIITLMQLMLYFVPGGILSKHLNKSIVLLFILQMHYNLRLLYVINNCGVCIFQLLSALINLVLFTIENRIWHIFI